MQKMCITIDFKFIIRLIQSFLKAMSLILFSFTILKDNIMTIKGLGL